MTIFWLQLTHALKTKPHLLVTAMKAVLIDNDDEGEKTPTNQSSSSKYEGGGNDCHDEAV